jgi:hypothetical protein
VPGSLVLAVMVGPALSDASAQSDERQPVGTLRLGSVHIRPQAAIAGLGVDNNVFLDDSDPKSDTVFTAIAGAEFRAQAGPALIRANLRFPYRYFYRYWDQRSLGIGQELAVTVPINRVAISGTVNALNDRERPSIQIDLRARRLLLEYRVRADVTVSSKNTVGFGITRSSTDFADDAVDDGTNLARSLNRAGLSFDLSARHALTPFTSVVGQWSRLRDEFRSSVRDTSSSTWIAGVVLDRAALVSGSASIGYRVSESRDPLANSRFSGWIVSGTVSTVLRGSTRVEVALNRDLLYSVDVTQPYLLNALVGLDVTQRVTPEWELGGRVAWETAKSEHQTLESNGLPQAKVVELDGALAQLRVNYIFPSSLRLGFDVRRARRVSFGNDFNFASWLTGLTLSYGF